MAIRTGWIAEVQRPALLLLSALTACSESPEPQPAKGAPYAVGSTTVFIHDTTRPFDRVAGVNTGIRTLITEIWYPVPPEEVREDTPHATYRDYVFGDEDVHRRMMTQTTFFHLTPDTVADGVEKAQIDAAVNELFHRERGSLVDAPLAAGSAPWPVILMSHGDAGSRYNMATVSEHLAAHGYVVLAPEHTGNSPYSQVGRDPRLNDATPDANWQAHRELIRIITDELGVYGSPERHGQSYSPLTDGDDLAALKRLDASLVERVNDLRATLDWLARQNAEGPYAGRFAIDGVGLMGRSFGGVTTLAALCMEPRFIAGISVAPPALSDAGGDLPAEMLVDDRESVLLSGAGENPLTRLCKPTFLLSGAEDGVVIGLANAFARASGGEPPTAGNPHPALRLMFEASTQPTVWGVLANANHESLAVAGPYWWPELKPREQPRTFEPATNYTLIDAERAHHIQKVLALAFFDAFVRHENNAKAPLSENPFPGDGLELAVRNFH